MRRRNFFSAKLPGSFSPFRVSKSYFPSRISKSYIRAGIPKSCFPKRISKRQKIWIDGIVNGLVKALNEPGSLSIQTKPQKRKRFSKKTKDAVLMAQNNCCRACFQYVEVPEFDHIDGDRSNNSRFNCQALCPNCHAKKTRKRRF